MRDLMRRLAALSRGERRELLSRLCQRGLAYADIPLLPVAADEWVRLSHAQERIWFEQALDPHSSKYHLGATAELRGELDIDVLRAAVETLALRHQALRTRFRDHSGVVAQRSDALVHGLVHEDLSGSDDEADRRSRLQAIVHDTVNRPFALAEGEVFRAVLVTEAAGVHTLVLVAHHIAVDAHSLRLLLSELGELYDCGGRSGFDAGGQAVGSLDFAIHDRMWQAGPGAERQLAYWAKELTGVQQSGVPVQPRETATRQGRSGNVCRKLSEREVAAVEQAAKVNAITPFGLLLSAWQIVLARLSQSTDVVVGVAVSVRHRSEAQGVVGCLVNTMAARTRIAGHRPVHEFLTESGRRLGVGLSNTDVAYERVVEHLRRHAGDSRRTLFRSLFGMQATDLPLLRLGDVAATVTPVWTADSKVDLEMDLRPAGRTKGLSCTLVYDAGLIDARTADAVLKLFHTVVRELCTAREQRLDEIRLVSLQGERVVRQQSRRATTGPGGVVRAPGIDEVMRDVAARRPHVSAIRAGNDEISYAEIYQRALAVAAELRHRGVAPEMRVGVFLPVGVGLLTTMFGVFLAGATCMPLDPNVAAADAAELARRAGCTLVVADRTEFPGGVLSLSSVAWSRPVADGKHEVPQPSDDLNLAYLSPVGVGVTYAVIAKLLSDAPQIFGNRLRCVLATAPVASDRFLVEVLLPLAGGGTLVLSESGTDLAVERRLPDGISLIAVSPPVVRRLVRHLVVRSPITVCCHPTPMTPEVADEVRQAWPKATIINAYGGLEAGPLSMSARIQAGGEGRSTMGFPGTELGVSVLNDGQPVGPWIPGEIAVDADARSRGYPGQPGLTAERFLPDPRGQGRTYFSTGELGRFRDDGELEWLGHLSRRVTVAGARVDLDQVEDLIRTFDGVLDVAVVPHIRSDGEAELTCYVQPVLPSADPSTVARSVRRLLRTYFPRYGRLRAVETVGHVPYGVDGRIDHACLAARLDRVSVRSTSDGEEATERMVADVFAEVLGVTDVGREDDFFALGGSSLLVVGLVEEIRQRTGIPVPIEAVFEWSTVAMLAEGIRRITTDGLEAAPELRSEWDAVIADIDGDVLTPEWQ